MLKGIALAGVFFLASAVSPAISGTASQSKKAAKIAVPSAPTPQGFCPWAPACP
jgi:hypothetical protein